jgi:hypothetical protein
LSALVLPFHARIAAAQDAALHPLQRDVHHDAARRQVLLARMSIKGFSNARRVMALAV